MRLAALTLLALVLPATTVAGTKPATSGSLAVDHGRGVVVIKGKGALVGRIDKGSLQITDITATDQWSPRVNGVPRGKVVWIRGHNIRFYVPGGRYQIIARGEGISVSARGSGQATITGEPDTVGDTGVYSVGDEPQEPLPIESVRLSFGPTETSPSAP